MRLAGGGDRAARQPAPIISMMSRKAFEGYLLPPNGERCNDSDAYSAGGGYDGDHRRGADGAGGHRASWSRTPVCAAAAAPASAPA